MSLKSIIGILLCVAIGVAVVLLLGYLGISPFTMAYTYVSGWFSNFNLSGVIENPASALTVATGAISGAALTAAPLYNQIKTWKSQAQTTAATAQTEIASLTTDVNKWKAEAEAATKELTALKANPPPLPTDTTALNTQISNLQGQVEGITNQHNAFVKGLMQAANNTLICDPLTGITYNCIEKPPQIIVK